MSDEFWTMKEIGAVFGVTSHVIGKRLKEIGLRTADGKPSRAAFDGGYCAPRWTSDGMNYCWAWEKTKTIEALEWSGLTTPQPTGRRTSPDDPGVCPAGREDY